jgi:hypothetical protein
MKRLGSLAIAGCLMFLGTLTAIAQESDRAEVIRHISPDKKFAMRILCDSKPADPANIDADSVKAVDIVSLPGKEVVGKLPFGGYDGLNLVWSGDSKWCAFYSMSGTRQGETSVHRLQGEKFVQLETGDMSVEVKGDTRNQYVEPARWLKPGTLVLKQFTIFRDGESSSTIDFTVRFDESGQFHVISKRNKER